VDTGPLLILTFDQKGIVMRPEDLLDATAQGLLKATSVNWRPRYQQRRASRSKAYGHCCSGLHQPASLPYAADVIKGSGEFAMPCPIETLSGD